MIKNGVKTWVLLALLIGISFTFYPSTAKAIDFNPFNPLDPFCLFTDCNRKPKVINNTNSNNTVVNSNNTNSNINSGTITNTTPAAVSATSQGAIYTVPANTSASTIVNNNTATVSNPNPVVVQNPVYYSQPVYQTPVYTYPDYNYNYYPYSHGAVYYSPISIYCSANTTFAPVGTTVTWSAYPSGGSGSYSYSWSGTDGIYGSYGSLSTYYSYPGVKYAYVTVYSGGYQRTVQCSNAVTVGAPTVNYYAPTYVTPHYAYNPNTMQIACFADKTTARIGEAVTWNAEATGGVGNQTYTWSGTENIFSFHPSAIAMYQTAGLKSAVVKVTDASGYTQSKACGNTVTVRSNTIAKAAPVVTPTPPPVQAVMIAPSTTMASLFSLQNVPWGLVAVLVILALLSLVFYLMFNKKKI